MPSVRGHNIWYVLHLVCEINLDTRYRGKSMWAGPTRKIGKSMWAGPTREKKKRTYYILCQSYPQAQEGQINIGHCRISVQNRFYVVYRNYEDC
jgi:hypothetical protein